MAKKKVKLSLWKLSLALGVLLGIAIKVWDYVNVGFIRCGVFTPAQECTGLFQYLKELPIWIILGIIVSFVVIYLGKYVAVHVFHSAKNFKMPKAEFDEESKVKKTEKKEEVKKEVKVEKEEPESSQEKKKVIKI